MGCALPREREAGLGCRWFGRLVGGLACGGCFFTLALEHGQKHLCKRGHGGLGGFGFRGSSLLLKGDEETEE
ncbi:MAG: hypothetical protein ACLGPM_09735 [Acidobacteriota bacterium]